MRCVLTVSQQLVQLLERISQRIGEKRGDKILQQLCHSHNHVRTKFDFSLAET